MKRHNLKLAAGIFFLGMVSFASLLIAGCGDIDKPIPPTTTTTVAPVDSVTISPFQRSTDGLTSGVNFLSTQDAVVLVYSGGSAQYYNFTATQGVSARGGTSVFRQRERDLVAKYGFPQPQVKAQSLNVVVGTIDPFYIYDLISGNTYLISAECRQVATNCYVYLDVNATMDASVMTALANEFDTNSYPKVKEGFGDEWNPGIDNDSRITLVFTPLDSSVYGYFDPLNEYNKPGSNKREMLVMNSSFTTINDLKSTMAHEFQHLVNFSQKVILQHTGGEQTWLNEGLSVYAEQYCGYGLAAGDPFVYGTVYNFENNTSNISLTNFIDGDGASYAPCYLFVLYMAEQYGQAKIRNLESSAYTGTTNVTNVMGANFTDIYRNWVLANYLDGISTLSKYNYASINLRGTYTIEGVSLTLPGVEETPVTGFPYNLNQGSLEAYSCHYFRILPGAGGSRRYANIDYNPNDEGKAVFGGSLR